MTGDHDHDHETGSAAAYVLGALEPDERATFESHLETCEQCRQEIAQFIPIPGLLARARPENVTAPIPDAVLETAVERASRELGALTSSRRRWRWAAVAAATIAIALTGTTLPLDDDTTPTGAQLALTEQATVEGTIHIGERPWGTAIDVDITDLPTRPIYRMVVVARDGTRQVAATWGPTPTGAATLTGAVALTTDTVDHVLITSDDPADIITRTT